MGTIKIALADDHALVREGFQMLINSMKDFELVVSVDDGFALLEKLKATEVDVILLDIEMKGMGGIETLKVLGQNPEGPKVIMLSMHCEPNLVGYMVSLGARSYLPKNVSTEELEMAIRKVYAEGQYFNPLMANALMVRSRNMSESVANPLALSPREKEILELICKEYTTKEISDALCISFRTVEGHRMHLLEKLKVKNTAGLVKKAISLNLVNLV